MLVRYNAPFANPSLVLRSWLETVVARRRILLIGAAVRPNAHG